MSVAGFIAANMGHLLSAAAAVALTGLALSPILIFLARGWRIKKADVFSCFSPAAKVLYLKTFLKIPSASPAVAETTFETMYHERYGKQHLLWPTIQFAIVCLAATFLFAETGVTQIALTANGQVQHFGGMPPGLFAFLVLSGIPASAIAGAYLWLVSDLVAKAYRLNLKPADVLGSALRLAMAAAVGYGVTAMAKDSVAIPLAFALGAFPLDTVRIMVRRFATNSLGLGVGIDAAAKDPITKLNGVDQPTADRLLDADISTITQLAYCDPVQLCMKTGYVFAVIVDFASQALAWNYLEAKLDVLRPAGLRGAMEIWDALDDLRNKTSSDDGIRAAKLMDEAATLAGMTVPTFYNACEEIADDPYTIFLANSWRE